MKQKLITFVKWFYKDDKFKTLDYAKLLTAVPVASAIGYLLFKFFSFTLVSLIFVYYDIPIIYWSFNENVIFTILLTVIIFFGVIVVLGIYFEKIHDKSIFGIILTWLTKLVFIMSLFSIFLSILSSANIQVAMIWHHIIIFVILLVSILIVQFAPRFLNSSKGVFITIVVCLALTCMLIFMFNTYWVSSYDTVKYDCKNYIIGTSIGNQFYLIEYDQRGILTNHYRFVDKTNVTVTRQKLSLHPVNE